MLKMLTEKAKASNAVGNAAELPWGAGWAPGPQRKSLLLRDREEGRGRAPQSISSHFQEALPAVGTANPIPVPTVLRTGENGPPAGGGGSACPEWQRESRWLAHSVLLSHTGLGLEP